MPGWLSKLFGRSDTAAAAPATPMAPVRLQGRSPAAAAPAIAAAAVSTGTGTGAAPALLFGVRRPLVAPSGAVAAFEFSLPAALQHRLATRADIVTTAAYQAALMAAARPVLESSRRVLLRVGADVLARPGFAAQVPARTMLLVDDLARLPAEAAAALRRAGAFLGVPDGPPAAAPSADFVFMDAAGGDIDTLLLSAQRWQEARPRVPRVASGLAHVDDVERVLRAGFALAGGQLDRPSAGASARPLNAAAHRICELLNHLALDLDTTVVADAVRADVAMSYRLLRYVNSPAIGLSRGVESVEQGVTVLGRNELVRWLSVMLLSASEGRQATQALQEHALARGRLLELLAKHLGEPAPQALFSLGVLSMLEVLLQSPLSVALAPLRLNEAASQALLQHEGPWAGYLALASALDAADSTALASLSGRWGGTDTVFEWSAQAWAWAAELSSQTASAAPTP